MLKGAALFFTYLITIGFTSKKLKKIQHFWMFAISLSLLSIGYSNVSSVDDKCKYNWDHRSVESFTGEFINYYISASFCDDVHFLIENNQEL